MFVAACLARMVALRRPARLAALAPGARPRRCWPAVLALRLRSAPPATHVAGRPRVALDPRLIDTANARATRACRARSIGNTTSLHSRAGRCGRRPGRPGGLAGDMFREPLGHQRPRRRASRPDCRHAATRFRQRLAEIAAAKPPRDGATRPGALGVPMILGVDREHFGPRGRAILQLGRATSAPRGKLLGRYDKMHLVMFGEYVPLAERSLAATADAAAASASRRRSGRPRFRWATVPRARTSATKACSRT